MENKTILVVEDDKDARTTFALILGIEGYTVFEAENGKKAMETLNRLPDSQLPGCILLDLMMPVMDGNTLLDKMAENNNPHFKNIPVVIATANPKLLNADLEARSGVQLTKPIDLQELCDVIRTHYRRPVVV